MVARVRRLAGTRRVGHTGTLDPMATGVLVLCLGKATRLIPYIEEQGGIDAKEYEAGLRFGFETTTDDAEGEPRGEPVSTEALTGTAISKALALFLGEIQQTPPAFSAKKVAGERAYALARRGEDVELASVAVQVHAAELLGLEGDVARVRFACSRGTYIRALARDLGRALGVGAHLVALRRTRSGTACIDAAIRGDDLTPDSIARALQPMVSILADWPRVVVNDAQVADIRLGRGITRRSGDTFSGRVRVCDGNDLLVALAQTDGARVQPFCVF